MLHSYRSEVYASLSAFFYFIIYARYYLIYIREKAALCDNQSYVVRMRDQSKQPALHKILQKVNEHEVLRAMS